MSTISCVVGSVFSVFSMSSVTLSQMSMPMVLIFVCCQYVFVVLERVFASSLRFCSCFMTRISFLWGITDLSEMRNTAWSVVSGVWVGCCLRLVVWFGRFVFVLLLRCVVHLKLGSLCTMLREDG